MYLADIRMQNKITILIWHKVDITRGEILGIVDELRFGIEINDLLLQFKRTKFCRTMSLCSHWENFPVDESSIQRKGVNVILWHCCQVLSPMKTIANGARLPLLHLPLVQACQTKPFPNKDVKERELLLLCPDGKNWSTNHKHIFFKYSCRLEID